MKNFLQIGRGIDPAALLLQIRRQPDLWKVDTYLRDYPQGPFGEVESIILRFPPRTVHETEAALAAHATHFDQHENVDQPPYKLLTEARPLVANLMRYVEGERLGRVMVNKIAPGGVVYPHADTPVHANYWDRFHVVLESYPGVDFRCESEHVYMPPGTIWWFQNALEHEVINRSDGDRIHMIVDIRTSK